MGNSYLISAQPSKPLLNVWQLNRREQHHVKQVTPGVIQTLAYSPNGTFIVAGIGEKIYVWQTCNGCLLAVVERHYQKITCLAFIDDSSHFISASLPEKMEI